MRNITLLSGVRTARAFVFALPHLRASLALAACVAASSVTHASVLWDGNASKGTSVFKLLNLEDGATCSVVSDSTYGSVFRFRKPSGSARAEAHGARGLSFSEGTTYYIGWTSKITSTVTNNAIFQWKTYPSTGPNSLQNWPIVLKIINGNLTLIQRQPNSVITTLLSKSMSANTWYRHVLAIKVSRGTTSGSVQYWLNGTKQTFSNGSQTFNCKTWDGDYCDPKWGVYGAQNTSLDSFVGKLKIGTSYADVAP